MRNCCGIALIVMLLAAGSSARQQSSKKPQPQPQTEPAAAPQEKAGKPPAQPAQPTPKPEENKPAAGDESKSKDLHFDMTEVAPIVTHHQISMNGRVLRYTATAGRLPIKREDGKIEAEMFFVAYTLDGQDAGRRPLTFAFNGGPGSASVWLHMGALGPKRVMLTSEGFMPPPPYRMEDNQSTLLDRSDLVLVDAIGTGFSRAADLETSKKFWGVKGDIEAYGEFIRMFLTRYDRWTSPLFMLGESYGTTRAAGVAGYLADKGIAFSGITLLSTVLNFQTVENTKTNDQAYIFLIPTYTMTAAYHHKLAPELTQDLVKTRQEAEHWASNEYAQALAKGDALTPQERETTIEQMARYTGLSKTFLDQADLRVDVLKFTHNLLLDQKLRVGRLDTRFTGPDPEGLLDTKFYDPTSSAIVPPYTAVFNNYVRNDLGYKSDMPYYVFASEAGFGKWEWGNAIEGFPDTASALRSAMAKDPYLKVLVMEGYYDLATPYYAATYTMEHLNLAPALRKNISFATYDCGHMVYLRPDMLAKMKRDQAAFMEQAWAGARP
jgi:carboxypeptidase C (cathepsin A)